MTDAQLQQLIQTLTNGFVAVGGWIAGIALLLVMIIFCLGFLVARQGS